MKLQKRLFVLLILIASFQIYFGQDTPKAKLIDEFGPISCDDLLARIDYFSRELHDSPNAKGYIIITSRKDNLLRNYQRGQLIKDTHFYLRQDASRFVFIHGEDSTEINTQFWIVPVGAENPTATKNSDYNLEIKKPVVYMNSVNGDGICPQANDIEIYSKLLANNSNLRGNLVIFENTPRKFRASEKKLLNQLFNDYQVPRSKLKTFYVQNNYSGVEFWLVPQKKK